MFFRKRLKSASLFCLLALAGSVTADEVDPGVKTHLVKLKKYTRTVITLVDAMVTMEVSDEDALAAIPSGSEGLNSRSFGSKIIWNWLTFQISSNFDL